MGVKDLWQLLAPVGRRVSIETLEGKVVAVDVSIWITQFVKAMRDDDGKMIKNAHLIGTIRRILRLVFPVYIFQFLLVVNFKADISLTGFCIIVSSQFSYSMAPLLC
jgi:hypothetical protein